MRHMLEHRLAELRRQFDAVQAQLVQTTANANAIHGAIQLAEQLLAEITAQGPASPDTPPIPLDLKLNSEVTRTRGR